jgi:hypothetical protein
MVRTFSNPQIDPDLSQGGDMACKSCQSHNQRLFPSEINIHIPGLIDLNKPSVLVFVGLVVCLNCGFTELSIAEEDLKRLKDHSVKTSSSGS